MRSGECASSGYGVQGKSLLPRLAALPEFGGRDAIAMFAWYGLQGGVREDEGFRVYPVAGDPYGNDVIGAHARDHRANLVVSLIDVWVMRETAKAIHPAIWCPWLPIDHDPVPQAVLRALEGAHLPLTYAKWGRDLLTDAGVPNHYIPHGVETDIYKILADRDRVNQCKREMLGIDDAHLTVMVAANKGFPDRKAFQVQLRAWAKFAETRPKARLYIHTEPSTQYGGIDFAALIGALNINGKVLFPNRYKNFLGYPQEYLSLLYNMADVFLGASMSEGFGIPIIEAQACGTPVVVTDFSAMPELVRWGVAVKPRDMVWTPMNSWQAWPDHEGITAALVRYYTEWMDTGRGTDAAWVRQSEFAQKAIHDEYDWDAIVRDQWTPLVRRLATEAPALCESEAVAP